MDETGTSIEPATVERVLRFGTADIPEKYLVIIREVAEKYAEDIFAALRKHEYNPDLVRLHIVGGGAAIVRNFGSYDPERVEIIDDICANAKGYVSYLLVTAILYQMLANCHCANYCAF